MKLSRRSAYAGCSSRSLLPRLARLMCACAAVTSALAPMACGGDSPAVAATKLDAQRLAAIKQLSRAQYAAIERVYVAALPLDRLNRPGALPTPTEIKAASRRMISACEGLPERDALLGVIRASCPAAARFIDATVAIGTCASAEGCKDALREALSSLKQVVATSRVSDRAVRSTQLSRSCERALVTPRTGYTLYRQAETALRTALRALDSGSDDELIEALTALGALDQSSVPTARQMLRRLRSGCR